MTEVSAIFTFRDFCKGMEPILLCSATTPVNFFFRTPYTRKHTYSAITVNTPVVPQFCALPPLWTGWDYVPPQPELLPSTLHTTMSPFAQRRQTGGTPVKETEIRHAVANGRFTDMLGTVVRHESMRKAMHSARPAASRKEDDLLVRFFLAQNKGIHRWLDIYCSTPIHRSLPFPLHQNFLLSARQHIVGTVALVVPIFRRNVVMGDCGVVGLCDLMCCICDPNEWGVLHSLCDHVHPLLGELRASEALHSTLAAFGS